MSELATAIAAVLEKAINQVLALDPETMERLKTLQGKVIAIELRIINVTLYLIPEAEGLDVFGHFEGEPDTILRGTPLAMAKMGMTKEAGDVLFAGDVEISGDVELGQRFRGILDDLDIDWEEHLSHLTGDVVAHKIGNLMRGALKWGKQTTTTLGQDAAEYLQEESRDLTSRGEVEGFLKDVDTLRSDVDRMEARITRLQHRLKERPQTQSEDKSEGERS
jgi:ubiquinone biosynthesis protein UbiJ